LSLEPKTWQCGHCSYSLPLPSQNTVVYTDTLMRIREHRFAHIVDALESESDTDILQLCEDESSPLGETVEERIRDLDKRTGSGPVEAEDAAYILAGITALLRDDLPRARRRMGS